MRRGLVAWSRAELPEAVFAARVARTKAAMDAAGLGALIVYSNNTRPAGASWLCGFLPYWSEGVLVLPRGGDPVLVVALTKRVATWIAATSRVASVLSTPRVGAEIAKFIAEQGGGRVGVVDRDGFPAGIGGDLAAAGVAAEDATAMFAKLRGAADPAELALAARAAAIAHDALSGLKPEHDRAESMIAAVEGRARAAAAEECYVAVAPDVAAAPHFRRLEGGAALGASYAVRASVAYKGAWVRVARTVFRDGRGEAVPSAAADRLAAAVAALPRSDGFAGMSWLVEGTRLAQPLEPLMGSRIAEPRDLWPGALVTVQAAVPSDGATVLLAAPAYLGAAGEPAALLVPPVFKEGD